MDSARKARPESRTDERLMDGEPSDAHRAVVEVLLVEPHEKDAAQVRRMLMAAGAGFALAHTRTLRDALARLTERSFDIVLIDLSLADAGEGQTLGRIRAVAPDAAVIALAGDRIDGQGRNLVLQGAQDYLSKSELVAPVLVRAMRYALERQRLVSELEGRVREAERSARDVRAIVRASADAIVLVDSDGYVRLVNPCAEQLFGRTADELVGQTFGFPIVANDTAEIDIERPDGETRVAELHASSSEWAGQPAHLAVIRDITERRQSEQRERELIREQVARAIAEAGARRARFLDEASRILLSSFDLAPTLQELAELAVPLLGECCVVDVVESDGRIRRLGVACSLEGGEAVVRSIREVEVDPERNAEVTRVMRSRRMELVSPLDRAALDRIVGDAAATLEAIGFTSALIVPLVNRTAVGCMTFLAGPGRGAYSPAELTTAEDLGRRALVAIENTRLYEAAQRANRTKADFLAVMSHELRTPLNAVIGYSDLLLMGVPSALPEPSRHQVEKIRLSGRHLLGLIEEILAFARMEAGREQVRAADVSLFELADQAADITTPLAHAKNLEFELVLPDQDVTLHTDGGKVRQILLNLLSNAVKFTDEGGVRLVIEKHSDSVEFHVRDTGMGIDPGDLEHTFEPFWQAESSRTRSAEGTGLGLSVARRFARLLGGDVTVWSETSRGTTFSVRLPVRIPPLREGAGEEPGPL
jgi:signal transduction histidine kinase